MARGFALREGGGRGLTAWDAVCVEFILAVSDPVVQLFAKLFFGVGPKMIKPRT
jgi:hypothetical protein